MDRSGLTRGTRCCQACFPTLSSLEVIHEKNITPKNDIFIFGDRSYLQYYADRQSEGTDRLRGSRAIIWLSYNPASLH